MPRRNHRANPSLVIRVADRDNKLASHVKEGAGWAIGFVQAKCRQLDAQLRARNNGRLPPRTFHWAIPNKSVKRIILKVDVLTQSWFAKIIVGAERFGNFIWNPSDDVANPPEIPLLFRRSTRLVQADGFEGPYTATAEDLVAGNVDWKGRKRRTDAMGDPLLRPITDVLSWSGPRNRYGPNLGETSALFPGGGVYVLNPYSFTGVFVYKDGAKYFRAPLNPASLVGNPNPEDGVADPTNDINLDASQDQVCGAAIQIDDDGNRRDIVITDKYVSTGGPQDVGTVKWFVWWRDSDSGLTSNGHNLVDSDDPGHDPTKWTLIEEFDAVDTVAVDRYRRHRNFFFNRNGTQASHMMPDNTYGDDPNFPTDLPIPNRNGENNTNAGLNHVGLHPTEMPWFMRLVTVDIDAFAETASFSVADREGANPVKTLNSGPGTGSASGTVTQACAGIGTPGAITGGFSSTGSVQSTETVTNPGPWTVCVDYKGDRRVFGRIEFVGDWGRIQTSSYSVVEDRAGSSVGTWFGSDGYHRGYKFVVDELSVILSEVNFTTTLNQNTSTASITTTEGANSEEINPETTRCLYLDLRQDLIIWSSRPAYTSRIYNRSGGFVGSSGNQGFPGPYAIAATQSVGYSTEDVITQDDTSFIQVKRGNDVLVDWRASKTRAGAQIGGPDSMDGTQASSTLDAPLCGVGDPYWSETIITGVTDVPGPPSPVSVDVQLNGPPSLESMFGDDSRKGVLNGFNPQVATHAAVDTAGNLATSIYTFLKQSGYLGDVFVPADWPQILYLNYIDGGDINDISNQVIDTYDNNTPLDPDDDIDLDPVDADTGRAEQIGVI